jgi:sensor domain CHASE-containing protein
VNLRSRLLLIGAILVLIQLIALGALYYFHISPQIERSESAFIEKDLNRSMAVLQREFYHLEGTAKLLAQHRLLQKIAAGNYQNIDNSEIKLRKEMLQQGINAMYILNNSNQVIWQAIIDVKTEEAFPDPGVLVGLWQSRSDFLTHPSLLSFKIGIFNSAIGPFVLISTPIASLQNLPTIAGTLLIGQLITPEVVALLQTLSLSDMKLWPLGGSVLDKKGRDIIQKLQQTESDFLVDKAETYIRGYMFLPDINNKPQLLLSTTVPRTVSILMQNTLFQVGAIILICQLVFLAGISFLIRRKLTKPLLQLVHGLKTEKEWQVPPLLKNPLYEISILTHAVSVFMSRQQLAVSQETTHAFREGLYCARQDLFHGMEETLSPLLEGLEWAETKLTNLPTNDIEWIIAQCKTGKVNPQDFEKHIDNLQVINENLRHIQKELRNRLYELHTKGLRNAAVLRAQSRSLDPPKQYTVIPTHRRKEKSPLTRS